MYLSKIEVEKSGKTVSIFTPQRDQFQNRPPTSLGLVSQKKHFWSGLIEGGLFEVRGLFVACVPEGLEHRLLI